MVAYGGSTSIEGATVIKVRTRPLSVNPNCPAWPASDSLLSCFISRVSHLVSVQTDEANGVKSNFTIAGAAKVLHSASALHHFRAPQCR